MITRIETWAGRARHHGRRRATEAVAMAMIGDGLIALVAPKDHVRLWAGGPRWWRRLMKGLAKRPALARSFGAAEAALGGWLAARALGRR